MRRRSDRKKSTDVQPTPPSRRSTRRSRKSSEDKYESRTEMVEKEEEEQRATEIAEERRRSRSTRNYSPMKELSPNPVKQANSRFDNDEAKVETIPEEENDGDDSVSVPIENYILPPKLNVQECSDDKEDKAITNADRSKSASPKETVKKSGSDVKIVHDKSVEKKEECLAENAIEDNNGHSDENESGKAIEGKVEEENEAVSMLISPESSMDQNDKSPVTTPEVQNHKSVTKVNEESKIKGQNNDVDLSLQKSQKVNSAPAEIDTVRGSDNENNCKTIVTIKSASIVDSGRTRKRKWLTKKTSVTKMPTVLSISTDSLKELISDVQPVPLSDVRLESSSDIEEVESEREEGEESSTDDESNQVIINNSKSDSKSASTSLSTSSKRKVELTTSTTSVELSVTASTGGVAPSMPIPHAPSPARNQCSNILYITNLVRPFTVLQLKGLLARTGNIVEDGFWIDRIKSKCYVEYETEDQAIETRHALHGIRWPVSNPKCLNVEFSVKADMDEAVRSTKDEAPKLSQDNNRDNYIVGGWTREHNEVNDKKGNRPVREWDVGKKDSLERDKSREAERRYSKERNSSSHNDSDRKDRDRRDRRNARGRDLRSSSLSPGRKIKKKENEPPLRLLDDLFRKTKATPCIYWLPLTPEQIAEKEAFRQKRIEEHKERIKQRELEMRNKESEKDRNRRERDRDQRRRSRSRDRRRY